MHVCLFEWSQVHTRMNGRPLEPKHRKLTGKGVCGGRCVGCGTKSQLQQGAYGGFLHICCDAGFGEHEVPMSMLITQHTPRGDDLGNLQKMPLGPDVLGEISASGVQAVQQQIMVAVSKSVERQDDTIFEVRLVFFGSLLSSVVHCYALCVSICLYVSCV